jgi:RNA polymerase sigma-70 factor (sigma-E family)
MGNWETALTRLVAERGGALKRYAYVLCGDDAEADDLLQDALVRAFTRPGRHTDAAAVEGYVRRIVLNRFLDERRRRTRWRRLMPMLAVPDAQPDTTDDHAERGDFRAALATLSPRQRACLALRFYADQSVGQIAEQLGCSEGSVKRHVSDGLRRLGERIESPIKEMC